MNWVKNEDNGSYEATFSGKLISISDKWFQNANGKQYKICNIDLNGKTITAIMHEKNFNYGVQPGVTYQAKAIYDESRGKDVLVIVSHLVVGQRATIDDFEFESPKSTEDIFANAKAEEFSVK
jgi:phage tail sheath protein FI